MYFDSHFVEETAEFLSWRSSLIGQFQSCFAGDPAVDLFLSDQFFDFMFFHVCPLLS